MSSEFSSLRRYFPKRGPVFLAVIRCGDGNVRSIIDAARAVVENGAEGFFLEAEGPVSDRLIRIYIAIRQGFPSVFIGLRFKDRPLEDVLLNVLREARNVGAVWGKDTLDSAACVKEMKAAAEMKRDSRWGGLLFTSVDASRCGREMRELNADVVVEMGSIVTEEGKFNYAPHSSLLMDLPSGVSLGAMQGVTSANVTEFVTRVGVLLASTSIEVEDGSGGTLPGVIEEGKVRGFAKALGKE